MRNLLWLPFFLFFTACGVNSPVGEDATVVGEWALVRALRNNMETATLDGLYYEFREDGTLVTNLMSEEPTTGRYEWDAAEITTEGVSLPLTYTINALTDSTLAIQSNYQGYQFNFELARR